MITALIIGAGATKDVGGPLTNEILFQAYQERSEFRRQEPMDLLLAFISAVFSEAAEPKRAGDLPALPLLLSLLDTAIDRKQPLANNWASDSLVEVREALEYAVFELLDQKLGTAETTSYWDLLNLAYPEVDLEPLVISLNYDIVLDRTMFYLARTRRGDDAMPSYVCDVKTPTYQNCAQRYGRLFKLHGSLNWIYCPGCHRLDIGFSKREQNTSAVAGRAFGDPLDDRYMKRSKCQECQCGLRPILITPSYRKDYRNPHVTHVWYEAERALRDVDRVIFVGYSLPNDDVEVIYLLKRGLSNVDPEKITVVEKDKRRRRLHTHPVGQRYRSLFGRKVDWRTEGLSQWLRLHQEHHWPIGEPRVPKA